MLHQTFLLLGQLWQLFEVSQILEFLQYYRIELMQILSDVPLEAISEITTFGSLNDVTNLRHKAFQMSANSNKTVFDFICLTLFTNRKPCKCLCNQVYQARPETSWSEAASVFIPMLFLVSYDKIDIRRHMGLVVQSVISLTKLLIEDLLSLLARTQSSISYIFAEKSKELLRCKSSSQFFGKKW